MTSNINETELTSTTTAATTNTKKKPLADIERGGILGGGGDDNNATEEETNFLMKFKNAVWGKDTDMWTMIWQGSAIACILLNLIAVGIYRGMMFAAAFFALIIASSVFYFQFAIQDTDSLRQVQNDLRKQVNDFATFNASLTTNVTKLSSECNDLQETEHKLQTLATESGTTSSKLKELVKENQSILKQESELIQSDVVQAMIEIIFQSDRDESSEISDKELHRLCIRMKALPSITMNEELFKLKVKSNRSLRNVISLVQDIGTTTDVKEEEDDNDNTSDHIFTINEEGVTKEKE